MTENFLSAVLTFGLLAGGTVAVGSEMLGPRHAAVASATVATLPTVTVVGRRTAAAAEPVGSVATLPLVTVVGKRAALATVTLPAVVVIGCRHADGDPDVADEDHEPDLANATPGAPNPTT